MGLPNIASLVESPFSKTVFQYCKIAAIDDAFPLQRQFRQAGDPD